MIENELKENPNDAGYLQHKLQNAYLNTAGNAFKTEQREFFAKE